MDTIDPNSQVAALARRYGAEAVPPVNGPWNDTIAFLLSHRTIRAYKPDPLPAGTLETLIAAASSASTSSNLQTWSVVAVTDHVTKVELSKVGADQKYIYECPLLLVWIADLSRNNRLGREEGVHLAANDTLEMLLMAAMDATLAAQNATVAAESLGLGMCYIGGLRNDAARVAELLKLPPGAMAVFGMCVGYPKDGLATEVKPRLPQSIVLHRETYKVGSETADRTAYDKRMAVFSKRNDVALQTWTQRVMMRLSTLTGMSGRQHLAGVLQRLGFPLK
jgi:nitroreductase